MVAALPSTTPRPVHKSSTDDLGHPLYQVSVQEMASTLAAQAKAPEWDGVSELTIIPQAKTDVQWYRCRD